MVSNTRVQGAIRVAGIIAAVALLPVAIARAQPDGQALSTLAVQVACAPSTSTGGLPEHPIQVLGGGEDGRTLFSERDLLVIDGGTDAGLQLGQEFFLRRPMGAGGAYGTKPRAVDGSQPMATFSSMGNKGVISVRHETVVETVGWIRLVALNATTSLAQVEHACQSLNVQDYLEPFAMPEVPSDADRDLAPGVMGSGDFDFSSLGRVLYGAGLRETAGVGDVMLIDRGTEQGVTLGARLAVFRDLGIDGLPLSAVGETVVVAVGEARSLARISRARDAVRSGDYVVPHR
jgi:hypothetical protein